MDKIKQSAYMQISKKDWKLFRACVANWQETYMERLVKEYMILLEGRLILFL